MRVPMLTTPSPTLQSTLPHGERLFVSQNKSRIFPASIHAPARGATFGKLHCGAGRCGLQSTLPHGERPLRLRLFSNRGALQSTLPHGERRGRGTAAQAGTLASIHAPARGATLRRIGRAIQTAGFNPRSRTGSDYDVCNLARDSAASIHAPARGATLVCRVLDFRFELQSTLPHGERRRQCRREYRWTLASIHAPARGATAVVSNGELTQPASIHAPARGATSMVASSSDGRGCFNPRSRTGSDSPGRHPFWREQRFNPRSRTGSDY